MLTKDTKAGDQTRLEFIELIGRIFQTEGLPRNAGRLMGLLIFDGGQIPFKELAERLQISRGSVSSSSRLLEEFGLIRRLSKPGERQDYFELEEDPYVNLLKRAQVRAGRAKEMIEKTAAQVSDLPELNKRITDCADFYRSVEHCISRAQLEIKET